MIIRLKVFEQTLSIADTKSVPRKGSKDYLGLQFMFSSDWKDLEKICYLQHGEVSLPIDVVDNLVEVPEWFTEQDSFDVTLFGKGGSQEVPTNVVSLRLEKSNTLWEQDAPEPQQSWIAKIIDLNNHPPVPGNKGYWMLWDTDKGEYVESDLPLPEVSSGGAVDDVQVNGTSVVADGVANIPMANQGVFGVVKFDTYTPFIFNAGALRLANADEQELTNPRYGFSTNRVITAANYRLAVKLAMCDGIGAAWTAEEQAAARERIGLTADGAWQYVTLTADDYDAENHRFLIDAGEGRQITEVYGMGQVVTDTSASKDLTVGIGFGNANNISFGIFGNYSIKTTDTQTSFSFEGKSIDFTSVKSDTYSQFGTVKYNTSKSATSNFYVDADIKNAANVKSLIYWKYNNPRYFSIFGLWDNVTWAAIKIYIKLR